MTDVADAAAEDAVMIALLPTTTEWCRQELPHMTLVYVGLITDLQPTDFNELAKDAASIAMMSNPVMVRVTGVEVFGDMEKVDVLKLEPTSELLAMRRVVEDWNASEFPFKPHCTIGPTGGQPIGGTAPDYPQGFPNFLFFDRIMVAWGNQALTFWLKR